MKTERYKKYLKYGEPVGVSLGLLGRYLMEEISATYKVTRNDLKTFIKNSANKVFHYNLYIIAFSVLALISVLFLVFIKPSPYIVGVLVMSVIFILLLLLTFYILPLSTFKEEKAKQGTYIFSDYGVKIETDVSSVNFSWKLYKAVYIIGDMLVFRLINTKTWFLPYNVFGDDIMNFEKLLYIQRDKGLIDIIVIGENQMEW